jgi:hypothetical protein
MKPATMTATILSLLVCMTGSVFPQEKLARSVFGCGGIPISDAAHGIVSTLGQPCIGRISETQTQGRIGFWYAAMSGQTSAEKPDVLPSGLLVMDNYPNPFREKTTLRFSLPRRSDVAIDVYDLLGREIAGFHPGELDAGMHEIAIDRSALPRPAGAARVYYCRIAASGMTAFHAMIGEE